MGVLDYKLERVPPRSEIVAACSNQTAEEMIETVKVLSDADPLFKKGFKAFLKAGPAMRKQIHTADARKSEAWSEDIMDHEDAIKKNDQKMRDAKTEKARLATEHDATIARLTSKHEAAVARLTSEKEAAVARLTSENEAAVGAANATYQEGMATQTTAIARWNQDTQQRAKEIQAKNMGKAVLTPSLQIMETINNNPPFMVAGLSGIETAQELLKMTTEDLVQDAVNQRQPDGEDSSGTKILIALAALGVNWHETHGEEIDINPKRVRRMGKATQVRLICQCLRIGDAVGGLFSVDIERNIRRDESQDRKRSHDEDPDSPVNKFHKKLKEASDNSPYKDRIDSAADEDAIGAGTDDSQE